jgi:hypothetical protein
VTAKIQSAADWDWSALSTMSSSSGTGMKCHWRAGSSPWLRKPKQSNRESTRTSSGDEINKGPNITSHPDKNSTRGISSYGDRDGVGSTTCRNTQVTKFRCEEPAAQETRPTHAATKSKTRSAAPDQSGNRRPASDAVSRFTARALFVTAREKSEHEEK